MLAAEATRLAAIEILCPTKAIETGVGFATLAKAAILDSRNASLQDLDPARQYTPVVAVYTVETDQKRRGDLADFVNLETTAYLEFVAELAISGKADDGTSIADAMAGSDPDARLVLSALVEQIRFAIFESEAGYLLRSFAIPDTFSTRAFAVPELGLRWHRITARMGVILPPDSFVAAGGLPRPLRDLAEQLPENSYAKSRLSLLAAHFAPITRQPLTEIVIREGEDMPPVASVEFPT